MNEEQKQLKKKIMKRVFRSWFLRSTLPLIVFELVVIFFAVFFAAKVVFVGAVVNNALIAAFGNPFALLTYFWNAFWNTSITTQGLIILLLVTFLYLLRQINKIILSYILTNRDINNNL
ncbi:MAG: hypothetical protein COU07_02490 [Candidatus Harrisonbacteria bacterium CG10_big_fil_rev_8_21_14_0_10_40_38]|uniref:Uncharacterized protein n=1 Tax=Candidatus Harrisonbacteria bacterium CG10_big_fil_rev_8_21_14_0_10_40_38 TaxID=1974583 RepID=A0A2H0URZ5_9BACT|nr:MAG: hypothetical protein COU07_02490 [Candidatus Harrisonbacteria bacterium CG10_big_fil_rev_8_21_14_0_10_40_38]